MSVRVDGSVLKWLGHIDRMSWEWVIKRVYVSEVDGLAPRCMTDSKKGSM